MLKKSRLFDEVKTSTKRSVRTAIVLSIVLVISASVLITGVIVILALRPASNNIGSPSILITVPRGAGVARIGQLLRLKRLVRSARGFEFAARFDGVADKLKAGRYEISASMPPRQIAQMIAMGMTADDLVTIPEGFTVQQIARRLQGKHIATSTEFLDLARKHGREFSTAYFTPPTNNLEGYLYPDTYRFPKGTDAKSAIAIMLANFRNKLAATGLFELPPRKLQETVTLASIVEREAQVPQDRPLIAAALINRLALHMRLECDATIQYALPEHKSRLYYADLRLDSPYNSYRHAGLPPTPISNPGKDSILASLHPAKVGYLYYVAKPDGSHIFTKTLAEHDKARLSIRAANK